MPPDPYRYWAFISYASEDKSWARWLQRAIESYGIPARLIDHELPTGEPVPKRFKPLFRDRSELPAAADLGGQIEVALRASRYLIVVCSPAAARSRWVEKEVATFQALQPPGRVLTLIVDGEPDSGDARECFPASLRAGEPLAADAREQGDGKRDALLKLLAGMLGVGFDALKQRDTRRRIRRLQATIAVALAIAVGFAGITVFALGQRSKAIKERNQAEGILGYLLVDVPQLLGPVGRLDIVEDVQKKVDDYYGQMGVEEDIPLTLWNRAAALGNKGSRLMLQNQVGGALREYRAALKIMADLSASQPDNVHWRRALAVAHQSVGRALEKQDRLPEAQRSYEAALKIMQGLTGSYPGNLDYQRELSSIHSDAGDAFRGQWDLAGALGHYGAAMTIMQRLTSSDGQNTLWQDDLSVIHRNMASAFELGGKLDEALGQYRASLKIDESLAASDPLNTTWRQSHAGSHNSVAVVLKAKGDLTGALRHYRAALEIKRSLVSWDPGNTEWRRGLAVTTRNVGGVLWARGDLDGALRQYRAAAKIDEWLASLDPSNADARKDLSTDIAMIVAVLEARGIGLEARGDLDGALKDYRAAMKILQTLTGSEPDNAEWQQIASELRDCVQRVLLAQQRAS
jgi:tetratricopeptide (TPR) repeat protein